MPLPRWVSRSCRVWSRRFRRCPSRFPRPIRIRMTRGPRCRAFRLRSRRVRVRSRVLLSRLLIGTGADHTLMRADKEHLLARKGSFNGVHCTSIAGGLALPVLGAGYLDFVFPSLLDLLARTGTTCTPADPRPTFARNVRECSEDSVATRNRNLKNRCRESAATSIGRHLPVNRNTTNLLSVCPRFT